MRIFLLQLLILFQACQQQTAYKIEGPWQMDSTLHFYNQFQYSEAGDEKIIYHYLSDTLVISNAVGKKVLGYELEKDSLKWLDPKGAVTLSAFQILSLKSNQMVLKEALNPMYAQKNQSRYQLYYFSRMR